MPDVRVVTLAQQLDHSRDLGMIAEHDESECGNGRSTNIVVGVRDSDMQKLPDCLVVCGTRVSQGDGVHSTVTQNSVL